MEKICMVVAEHPFLDSRIFKKEAKTLANHGYDVTLIVPRKNGYLFDVDGQPFTSKFLEDSFIHEGIKIITYHSEECRPFLNKVLSDTSVWEKEAFHNPLTLLAIEQDADIYHVHEYLSLFAGVGIKRLMKKKGKEIKLIYDSHELVPDPLDKRYSEPAKNKLKERLIYMLKEVDQIITVSDSIKSWYLSHLPSLPVEVVYNSPPLSPSTPKKTFTKRGITICYEGNIDAKKGNIKKIIGISEICSRAIKNFQFQIIGGPRYGESIRIPKHLKNTIQITGWVDYHDIHKHMQDGEIGWIDFDDLRNSLNRSYALPNKFFSYLNNGVPILVNKCPEMETFVRKHQCGHVVNKPHATAKDFADAILYLQKNKKLLENMSLNARKIMEEHYSWEHMKLRLLTVYKKLTQN